MLYEHMDSLDCNVMCHALFLVSCTFSLMPTDSSQSSLCRPAGSPRHLGSPVLPPVSSISEAVVQYCSIIHANGMSQDRLVPSQAEEVYVSQCRHFQSREEGFHRRPLRDATYSSVFCVLFFSRRHLWSRSEQKKDFVPERKNPSAYEPSNKPLLQAT